MFSLGIWAAYSAALGRSVGEAVQCRLPRMLTHEREPCVVWWAAEQSTAWGVAQATEVCSSPVLRAEVQDQGATGLLPSAAVKENLVLTFPQFWRFASIFGGPCCKNISHLYLSLHMTVSLFDKDRSY